MERIHIYLKTGDLEHSQEDNTSVHYLKHCLEVCVNTTVIWFLKDLYKNTNFSSRSPSNQCQKFLKGGFMETGLDIPRQDLTKTSSVTYYNLVTSLV